MKENIKCNDCGTEYNLDLDKYGGKKIKCKQCAGIISVPTAAEAADEFEVVEEAAETQVSAPQSVFQRHRTASQSGAVNIALLQRSESSRDEIRKAFLAIHGDEPARRNEISEKAENDLANLEIMMKENTATLEWFKQVYSRALAITDETLVGGHLTNPVNVVGKMFATALDRSHRYEESDEDVFSKSVELLGKPVGDCKEPVWFEDKEGAFKGFFKAMGDVTGKAAKQQRQAKMETVKAAIEYLEKLINDLQGQVNNATTEVRRAQAAAIQEFHQELDESLAMIHSHEFAKSLALLERLQRTSPVDELSGVLTALSQATFISGNPTQAARHIQEAICFGATAPADMGPDYNSLWAKAAAGLPKS